MCLFFNFNFDIQFTLTHQFTITVSHFYFFGLIISSQILTHESSITNFLILENGHKLIFNKYDFF